MTKLTNQAVLDEIVALVEMGNHVAVACQCAGITTGTYYRWLIDGGDADARLASDPDTELSDMERRAWEFWKRIRKATALSETYAAMVLRGHQGRNWKAAMEYLERGPARERWRRRRRVVMEQWPAASDGIDVQALLADPEASRMMHEALAHVAPEPVETMDGVQKRIGSKAEMDAYMRPAAQ